MALMTKDELAAKRAQEKKDIQARKKPHGHKPGSGAPGKEKLPQSKAVKPGPVEPKPKPAKKAAPKPEPKPEAT